jgi:hypothetical protein
MPFTPAHPAIVLPFLRWSRLSASGLVVGSIAPDFEYFFKMNEGDVHSHTIPGLIYFDIPVVFLLAFLFHSVVKANLFGNLPRWLRSRFQETLDYNFVGDLKRHPWRFTFSALLGSASHLFWDSFTHPDGYFVNLLWFYEGTTVRYDGATYPLYYALQHFSTYIGMFFVVVYIMQKKPSPVTASRISWRYWIIFLFISVAVVWLRFFIRPEDQTIGNVVISITGMCIGLIVCGLLTFKGQRQTEAPGVKSNF